MHSFLGPALLILIRRRNSGLRFDVSGQVGKMKVVVSFGQQRFTNGFENAWLVSAEVIVKNQLHGLPCFRFILVVPAGIIPAASVENLIGREAEHEGVLFARFFSDFDVGSVPCSDRQCTVHHEFHIARPTGFVASG